jgi:hypothetical protein
MVIAAIGAACTAGESSDDSATQVAMAAYDALAVLDVEKQASFVHPAAMDELKEIIWPAFEYAATNDQTGQAMQMIQSLGVQSDSTGLVAMEPQELYVALMNFLFQVSPGLTESMQSAVFEPVGQVAESDTLVHVLTRVTSSVQGLSIARMEVTTMRKSDTGWMLALQSDMEGLAKQIRFRMMQ